MFSERTNPFQASSNKLYLEQKELARRGLPFVDLVTGNVNQQGIIYPQEFLQSALRESIASAKIYAPDPFGQKSARETVAAYYQAEGLDVPVSQIVLTPGTSVAYWYLFKLLGNPNDEFLCPQPSYPLFDSIASLSDVKLTSYRLKTDQRWQIDFENLSGKITPRTRAIILISPHNPTGAVATEEEIQELAQVAVRHQLPIICDEVFCPFLFTGHSYSRPAATEAPLVFTLNGFSKMFALPGMKIGWIAVNGEPSKVQQAMRALEMTSDTFLPMNEIAQFSVPAIFKDGKGFLQKYRQEIKERRALALSLLSSSSRCSFIPPEGGFYVPLRLKDPKADDEQIALDLLNKHGLLLHPGYFYDLDPGHLVLSYVSEPETLKRTLPILAKQI